MSGTGCLPRNISPICGKNVLRPAGAAVSLSPLAVAEAASRPLSFVRAEWWRLSLTSHTAAGAGQAQGPSYLFWRASVGSEHRPERLGTLCQGGGRVAGVPAGTLLQRGWGGRGGRGMNTTARSRHPG